MLRDLDGVRREVARLHRPKTAAITPGGGGPRVEVAVGDTIAFDYGGEPRLALVQAILPWGVRGRDLDKHAVRAFRFDRMAAVGVSTPA